MTTRIPNSYYRPETLEDVVRLLSQTHIDTAVLSGGALRLGTTADPNYEALVDLQAVPGLNAIVLEDGGALALGGTATLQAVMSNSLVPPLVRRIIKRTVPWNLRNTITLGEAVEFTTRLPELIAVLLAFDAQVTVASPGLHTYPLLDLCCNPAHAFIPRKALITRLTLPLIEHRLAAAEAHVARTPKDAAIVSAVSVITMDNPGVIQSARLALAGVWPVGADGQQKARLALDTAAGLTGHLLTPHTIHAALAALDAEIAPVGDYRGSADYRRAMAAVMARRVLEASRVQLTVEL